MTVIAWHFIKLDANKILCNLTERDIIRQDNGNYKVTFKYDLSGDNPIGRDIISSEDTFADNALFFQLRKILTGDLKHEINENFMRSTLLFVDFKNIFFKKDWSAVKLPANTPSKKDLWTDRALIKKMEWLFEDGLELSFDGKVFKRFVPFDKSSSMAKNCQITFIDSQIKDALDKRLMLDMNFIGTSLVLSKFYAYRGLYLSTGYRVETVQNFPLNEETVIILDDCIGFLEKIPIFTATKQDKLWKYKTKPKDLKPNLFDGEGLISPDFAGYISNFLQVNYNFSTPSHSFQIRMPFIKGVLHEVNFNEFFSEQLQPLKVNELLIEDFFGITRDLRKAKIIMTKSMFKCANWIKELWKTPPNNFVSDPMKFFFEKFSKYDHALYVTNTEAHLSNPGRVRLNHQFLSTLALSVEDFNSLVAEQCMLIDSFKERFTKSFYSMPDFDSYELDDDSNPDEIIFHSSASRTTCLKALAKNPAFLKDPKVDSISKDMEKGYTCNLGLGRLEVEGEQRFLSRDLLTLLIKILAKVKNIKFDNATKNSLKKACLYQDRFFMPDNKLSIMPDKRYVFLRNPHLSRNEQVILRAYVNRSSLYEKYFSHLKGVVMVSAKSTAPMALGGADFDGDLVKIIPDKRIVQAVKRGNLDLNLLPIEIPSTKSGEDKLSQSIPLQVIINTFSNKIGLISNWAVTLSAKEYYSETVEEKYKNACAKCTIVVGLEIDAAKSGDHPQENIKEIQFLAKEVEKSCGKNIFLESKSVIEKILRGHFSPRVDFDNDTYKLYLSKKDKKIALQIPLESENTPIIDRLPARYLQLIFERISEPNTKKDKNTTHFNFEIPNWRKTFDKTLREKIKNLIEAYIGVLKLAGEVQQEETDLRQKNFRGCIITILNLQYDDYRCKKLSCGTEIETALNQIYSELSYLLQTNAKIKKAIESLKNRKWYFTRDEDRPTVAAEILGLNPLEGEKLPPFFELLYNFRCNGFGLFYFILKDLESLRFNNVEFVSHTNSEDVYLNLNQNPYYNELYQIYSQNVVAKKSKSIWNAQLIKICRRHLLEIFNGDILEALKHYWSQKSKDPNRKFLWDVFNEQEILPQIFVPQAQN